MSPFGNWTAAKLAAVDCEIIEQIVVKDHPELIVCSVGRWGGSVDLLIGVGPSDRFAFLQGESAKAAMHFFLKEHPFICRCV
ncbi:hypothetical protein [Pajaroellobacter abortibovis]|uniref:Uncharacterized protein n=1 Tax=Pajaroellobacter abortibovis TaxID=1882918 RepID=A0A1L6MUW3_9BACT|nr:hypothetical protein [Pajaroellobacter abortibovis]APR99255.1 hypothetical protein BCY86_00130 [Pajaroellobacter abortibovis]